MIEVNVKEMAEKIRNNIKKELVNLDRQLSNEIPRPCLATVIIGNDRASAKYVSNKAKLCEKLGIKNKIYVLPENATQEQCVNCIQGLNSNHTVHGILLQLPVPKQIDGIQLINLIAPEKDVDGLTIINQGKLFNDVDGIEPCTPLGIMVILKNMGVDVTGKKVCIIGRSNLLGKPLANMLLNSNATVTLCHSKTNYLPEHTLNADIVISCVGKYGVITPQLVKDGAIVIDAGTSFVDGKLVGDFTKEVFVEGSRDNVRYTPVPFGVGQMTTTILCYNVIKCYKKQLSQNTDVTYIFSE